MHPAPSCATSNGRIDRNELKALLESVEGGLAYPLMIAEVGRAAQGDVCLCLEGGASSSFLVLCCWCSVWCTRLSGCAVYCMRAWLAADPLAPLSSLAALCVVLGLGP